MSDKINTYLYVSDLTFMNKYCVNSGKKYKTNKQEYLPIINAIDIDIQKISLSKFIIYLKCVKLTKSQKAGFFGYFTGGHILISEKQSLEIKKDKNILVDELLYRKMIQKYNLLEVPNLYFIKYDEITPFVTIVSPTKIKEICDKNNFEFKRITSKYNSLNIINFDVDKIISFIEDEFENEDNQDNTEKSEDEDNIQSDKEENESEIINMDIPIVWNPCEIIIEKMENLEIKKNDIVFHCNKCKICEVVNNNRENLEFTNKKINFHIKENEDGKELVDKIIDFYQLTQNYMEYKDKFEECGFYETKINIIFYKNEGELYDKSFFIIIKF